MTPKKLIAEIMKREGLKRQVDVAQVTEIVGHVADMLLEEDLRNEPTENDIYCCLYHLAERRAVKRSRAN